MNLLIDTFRVKIVHMLSKSKTGVRLCEAEGFPCQRKDRTQNQGQYF